MKEYERIISEKIIDPSFFKEETRNDYLIRPEMKRIWAVGLDMLIKLDEVCRKHNIQYFLFYGSLLGAVRHKGFIPWDDDIDVVMPRKDYDRFISLSDEFKTPLFLQTPYTDPGYFYTYAKIRNSNTTGLTEQFKGQKINWGLMLDVYPLDYVSDDSDFGWYEEISRLALDNSNFMRNSYPNPDSAMKKRIAQYSGRNPLENYEDIQAIASRYKDNPTKHVSIAVLTLHEIEHNYFWAEDFEEAVWREFEGGKFPIPIGYDRVLSTLFGNYHELPPKSDRGLWHSNVLYDADVAYTNYT